MNLYRFNKMFKAGDKFTWCNKHERIIYVIKHIENDEVYSESIPNVDNKIFKDCYNQQYLSIKIFLKYISEGIIKPFWPNQ